jgi:hypothetical protein
VFCSSTRRLRLSKVSKESVKLALKNTFEDGEASIFLITSASASFLTPFQANIDLAVYVYLNGETRYKHMKNLITINAK